MPFFKVIYSLRDNKALSASSYTGDQIAPADCGAAIIEADSAQRAMQMFGQPPPVRPPEVVQKAEAHIAAQAEESQGWLMDEAKSEDIIRSLKTPSLEAFMALPDADKWGAVFALLRKERERILLEEQTRRSMPTQRPK